MYFDLTFTRAYKYEVWGTAKIKKYSRKFAM